MIQNFGQGIGSDMVWEARWPSKCKWLVSCLSDEMVRVLNPGWDHYFLSATRYSTQCASLYLMQRGKQTPAKELKNKNK